MQSKSKNLLFKVLGLLIAVPSASCSTGDGRAVNNLSEGGMTSGGWGTTHYEILASCDVKVLKAATESDEALTTATILKAWLGAAVTSAWYEIHIGSAGSVPEKLNIVGSIHLDGNPMDLRSMDNDVKFEDVVGSATLTESPPDKIDGNVEWNRKNSSTKTNVELSCTRNPSVPKEAPAADD
ncbi:MAG: hypothetical protein AB7T49_17920 [Oligoflexales bacterium]